MKFPQPLPGFLLGLIVGGTVAGALSALPAAPQRLVVGLKQPATPANVKTLARQLGSQIVQVAPSGAYLLIIPKKGQTAAAILKASPSIAYVEPEVAMGVADPERDLLMVIPIQRAPGKLIGVPPDLRGGRKGK